MWGRYRFQNTADISSARAARETASLARQLATFLRRERRLPLHPFRVSEQP